jgi:pheromone shutdown protein TraB
MSLNNHNLINKCNEFSEVVKIQCQRLKECRSLKVDLITTILLILLMLVLCGVSGCSILLLVFIDWLFYHIRTDIAVNAATTNSISSKPISRIILK